MFTRVELKQMNCNAESDSNGARPYLWAVLLQVDDDTIPPAVSPPEAVTVASVGGRTLIANGMRGGDSASIPDAIARFATWFRPGLTVRDLIFVAALWDQQDTPERAMGAGSAAFIAETRSAVSDNLVALKNATSSDFDAIIAEIKNRVRAAVEKAISDEIHAEIERGENPTLAFGFTADRLIDNTFKNFAEVNGSQSFTLSFSSGTPASDLYEIDASLVVTEIACESQLVAVESVQQSIANTQGALKQLSHGDPENDQKIEQLTAELTDERAKLKAAQAELARCRLVRGNTVGVGPAALS